MLSLAPSTETQSKSPNLASSFFVFVLLCNFYWVVEYVTAFLPDFSCSFDLASFNPDVRRAGESCPTKDGFSAFGGPPLAKQFDWEPALPA